MKLKINNLLDAFSYALDCVESELVGVSTNHSKRVAYICMKMGEELGLKKEPLFDLTACALLHDNALTEYLNSEYRGGDNYIPTSIELAPHCAMGEKNIRLLPFFGNVKGAILYHHEDVLGNGPFKKLEEETPIYAQLIHLADQVDSEWNLGDLSNGKWNHILTYVKEKEGILFSSTCVQLFIKCFEINGHNNTIEMGALPDMIKDYSIEELIKLATFFAGIIDYKSPFTKNHSLSIALRAKIMGEYYKFDEEKNAKLFLAGALHDIGKLVINNNILEKPGKLSLEEFEKIKEHARETYNILSKIEGFEEITSWASHHHEKLDGSGYPFGKKASELGTCERLMACLDIYQALVETRPYKEGMEHKKAMSILEDMADKSLIDKNIVKDIDCVFGG